MLGGPTYGRPPAVKAQRRSWGAGVGRAEGSVPGDRGGVVRAERCSGVEGGTAVCMHALDAPDPGASQQLRQQILCVCFTTLKKIRRKTSSP